MSAGTVPGMLEWMPISSGGAFAPIASVICAPQSPPCATKRSYPSRFISDEPGVRDVDRTPTGAGRLAREAVAGHRRNDHVERVLGVAAVCGRVGERADHVQHLDDRPRPAVRDDHRQRVLVRRANVDEVDVEPVDLGDEMREGVEPRLEPSEVVLVGPVASELLHRRQLHALRLVCDGLLLGPARRLQAPTQLVDPFLRDFDPERADRRTFNRSGRRLLRGGNRHERLLALVGR